MGTDTPPQPTVGGLALNIRTDLHRLGALEPGARIEVNGDTAHDYAVVERTMYDKDALPADLWRNSGPETLVLITCGGTLNKSTRRYEQNIVVYAVPIQDNIDTPQSI
jgi:hypothetical protein